MRGEMPRSLDVLCGVVVCVCHESDIEWVQPVSSARVAGQAVASRGATPGVEECGPGAAAAAR